MKVDEAKNVFKFQTRQLITIVKRLMVQQREEKNGIFYVSKNTKKTKQHLEKKNYKTFLLFGPIS
jgi:hypothetical protein